jgi:hypothetical protein
LHNQSFSNIISILTWLLIPTTYAWSITRAHGHMLGFFAHQIIPPFHLPSNVFLLYVVHQVGPPPSFHSQGDPLHLWPTFKSYRDSFFRFSHGEDKSHPTMWFKIFLPPLRKTYGFMFHVNKPMSFHPFPFNLLVDRLTLCFFLMTFAPWQT